MSKKIHEADSDSDVEDGGVKLNAPTENSTDAMDIDVPPTPADKRQAAALARAERAERRKQRREELAVIGGSQMSSLASTPNPESEPVSPALKAQETKPRGRKGARKSTNMAEKEEEEEKPEDNAATATATPNEAPAATEPALAPAPVPTPNPVSLAEPLPCMIDVNPTKAKVVIDTSASVAGDGTSIAPSSVNGGDSQQGGPNRAARRRQMQIGNRRKAIKKELGIPADSDERAEEVGKLLAAWTADFDEKTEARAAKKQAKKESSRAKAKGKLHTGRNNKNDEKQKQIKKQKQKKALRDRQGQEGN
ncbi:hypothetical protein CORC01_11516 [Colletotrichum orchidophilum]|uniref:Uncharacterized protein n=1 Tax=Colletotrichum orchidophilum TaxID=1209926 RepID=A0A1G4AVJ3_9PEZI|nr:uncharacterized protein CORC01_11516 [Colletotrichum orchidophilum]OHE93199.1 hypothetical protein CORC01_11516 [Colletotrichum orchidophilum]